MKFDFYRQLVLDAPFGYAHHEIILNDAGKPRNYRFIEVNTASSLLTGLNTKDFIGRTVLQNLSDITKDSFDWIQFFGRIALEGNKNVFEHYSESLHKWYRVQVYSSVKYFFTTLFTNITEDKLAELKLRKKTTLLQNFTDHIFDVIAMASLEGIFTMQDHPAELLVSSRGS